MISVLETSVVRGVLVGAGFFLLALGVPREEPVSQGSSDSLHVRFRPAAMRSCEWTLIPGIGFSTAQRLDGARQEGCFDGLHGGALKREIMRVNGVGEMILARSLPHIETGEDSVLDRIPE